MKAYNTRVAPSPTGYFHLGTARTAYFNYLMARATGGRFILRIDDTDLARNKDEYIDDILSIFDWLGLEYDELHYQSDRLGFYNEIIDKLLSDKKAYMADNGAVILKCPNKYPPSWNDTLSGEKKINPINDNFIDGIAIRKGDGMPTYNFCSIIDDMLLDTSLIIRGVDHISNTARQVVIIHSVFGYDIRDKCKFTHVGLIHQNVNGVNKKMSKRDGALSVTDYKNQGYPPEAILNHVLKLGWGHPNPHFDKEHPTITKDEAISLIQEGTFRATKSTHDPSKLTHLTKLWNKRIKNENHIPTNC
jgi:glutamyl-tRNA synthetase